MLHQRDKIFLVHKEKLKNKCTLENLLNCSFLHHEANINSTKRLTIMSVDLN